MNVSAMRFLQTSHKHAGVYKKGIDRRLTHVLKFSPRLVHGLVSQVQAYRNCCARSSNVGVLAGYIDPAIGIRGGWICKNMVLRDQERPGGGIDPGQFSCSRFGELGIQRTPILSGTLDP
jgi:hypothetical protein